MTHECGPGCHPYPARSMMAKVTFAALRENQEAGRIRAGGGGRPAALQLPLAGPEIGQGE